jgi:hypothetical protein
MKRRRKHFHDTLVQRSLETSQQPTLFEIGQERSHNLA